MALVDFKDLLRRTIGDKILRDKAINIAKNPKYGGYQRVLASMVYTFFDRKTSSTNKGAKINSDIVFEKKNYTNQLLGNLKNEKYTYLL